MRNPVLLSLLLAILVLALFGRQTLSQGLAWTTLASMPTPRTQGAAGVVNGQIYVIGGISVAGYSSAVEAYDPATNSWTAALAPLPILRNTAGTHNAVVNGLIYFIGGNAQGSCTSVNQAYDTSSNTWSTRASMPTARCHHAVVALNGFVYAIGGVTANNISDSNVMERYDPAANSWTTMPSMTTARRGAGAAVVNGRIYVLGGHVFPGVVLNTVEVFDPAIGTWATLAPTPTPRWATQVGVVNGLIYVLGGNTRGNVVVPNVEVFNPATNTWSVLPPMPVARANGQTGVLGCTLYELGGEYATLPIGPAESLIDPTNVLRITAPNGVGSLRIDNAFCSPGSGSALYLMAVTVDAPGAFPNGWFFGVAIPPNVLASLITFGAPFFGTLSPSGTSTYLYAAGIPSGLTLNAVAVAINPSSFALVEVSNLVTFVTP